MTEDEWLGHKPKEEKGNRMSREGISFIVNHDSVKVIMDGVTYKGDNISSEDAALLWAELILKQAQLKRVMPLDVDDSVPEVGFDQCEALCDTYDARVLGLVAGSRCTGEAGHSAARNGTGHYFPVAPFTGEVY